jgi:hypothetical protein
MFKCLTCGAPYDTAEECLTHMNTAHNPIARENDEETMGTGVIGNTPDFGSGDGHARTGSSPVSSA